MKPESILFIILGIILFDYFSNLLLEYLNLTAMKNDLPEELNKVYDPKDYVKSQEYTKTKTRFSFISSTFSLIVMMLALGSGFLGYLDVQIRTLFTDPVLSGLVFLGALFFANSIISLPFSIYSTFVIEEKYGFNRTTLPTFLGDLLKGLALSVTLGGLIGYLLLFLIHQLGPNFWYVFWVVIIVFTVFIQFFYTTVILPLFNKLVPLEEGHLRSLIESYSDKVAFPITHVFIIDGSKRSAKSNAFFSGFGKHKKVVLYDTLIEQASDEEILAVIAHEIGHYKKKHTLQGLAISIASTGLMLYIMSKMVFGLQLSYALGSDQLSIALNLLAFTILYSPISTILGILMNLLSRKNEYEADEFAAHTFDATHLSNALINLHVKNLSNLSPHPAYVFFNYSHPTLLQRVQALNKNHS